MATEQRMLAIEARRQRRLLRIDDKAFRARERGALRALRAERKRDGGACAICGERRRLVRDHCHVTGLRRGILCNDCNAGLGFFADDPGMLRAAARYIVRYRNAAEED